MQVTHPSQFTNQHPAQSHEAPIARADFAAILAEFVDARLNRSRVANGYMLPRTRFVDITAPGVQFVDADVRDVTGEGVTISRLGGIAELLPWSDVLAVDMRWDMGRRAAA